MVVVRVYLSFLMDFNFGGIVVRARLLEAVPISCISKPRFAISEVVMPFSKVTWSSASGEVAFVVDGVAAEWKHSIQVCIICGFDLHETKSTYWLSPRYPGKCEEYEVRLAEGPPTARQSSGLGLSKSPDFPSKSLP